MKHRSSVEIMNVHGLLTTLILHTWIHGLYLNKNKNDNKCRKNEFFFSMNWNTWLHSSFFFCLIAWFWRNYPNTSFQMRFEPTTIIINNTLNSSYWSVTDVFVYATTCCHYRYTWKSKRLIHHHLFNYISLFTHFPFYELEYNESQRPMNL